MLVVLVLAALPRGPRGPRSASWSTVLRSVGVALVPSALSSSGSPTSAPRSSTGRPARDAVPRGRALAARRLAPRDVVVLAALLWSAAAFGRGRRAEAVPADRLTAFVDPELDPQGASYNVNQSILAVGAGGLRGRGVDGATQTNLDYLPEHATDFAFASLAEQRGFVGAAILLLLYLLIVWRGLRVLTLAPDAYSMLVAGGIVFALLFQVFVNVGMTMGIAPVTGIPLPFVSVGGSSMITNLLAVGVLQAIHARGATPVVAKLPLAPFAVVKLVRELRTSTAHRKPIVLAGARSLVDALRRELVATATRGRSARAPPPAQPPSSTSWAGRRPRRTSTRSAQLTARASRSSCSGRTRARRSPTSSRPT